MLQLPRKLIKRARAVFRRLAPRPALTHARVSFEATEQLLRVRLHKVEAVAEFCEPGSFTPATIVLPLEALAELEGRSDAAVSLSSKGGEVVAQWQDGVVPRVKHFETTPLKDLGKFPEVPENMTAAPAGLLQALAAAAASAARDSIRYALTRIQMRGRTGEIAASDGRQLLIQSGFPFPWREDLLVPALRVFECEELADQEPVQIGRLEKHVALQAGAWSFFLPIDFDGRFPRVEEIVPKANSITASCRLGPEDVAFLEQALNRLPGREDDNAPITLDLDGQVVVRAKAADQERSTELVLAHSEASGQPVRLQSSRLLLERALRLGFSEIGVVSPDSPLVCRDDRRVFLWMPLDKEGALPPCANALRVVSDNHYQPLPATSNRRTTVTAPEPQETPAADIDEGGGSTQPRANGAPRRKKKSAGVNALVEEAEKLKALLRDAYGRISQLSVAIRRHRKQSQLMQSTLKSLRELHTVDA